MPAPPPRSLARRAFAAAPAPVAVTLARVPAAAGPPSRPSRVDTSHGRGSRAGPGPRGRAAALQPESDAARVPVEAMGFVFI